MKQDESERWNCDETCWIRMNQQWNNLFHGPERPWNILKQDETWSWNTLNQDEIVFHSHDTPWIRMKQCVSWSRNTLFHANETPWIRNGDHRDIYFFILIFGSSCFMVFHCAVSCCFIAVSCCFIAVSFLFHCCFMLFHGVSSLCFMVFQGVSLLCFILFHDHETGAVGTSLKSIDVRLRVFQYELSSLLVTTSSFLVRSVTAGITPVFSCPAASSRSSDNDAIDTYCLRKFLNAMISKRSKTLYASHEVPMGRMDLSVSRPASDPRKRLAKCSPATGVCQARWWG